LARKTVKENERAKSRENCILLNATFGGRRDKGGGEGAREGTKERGKNGIGKASAPLCDELGSSPGGEKWKLKKM